MNSAVSLCKLIKSQIKRWGSTKLLNPCPTTEWATLMLRHNPQHIINWYSEISLFFEYEPDSLRMGFEPFDRRAEIWFDFVHGLWYRPIERNIHIKKCTYLHTYMHTCMHLCMHTYLHKYLFGYMQASVDIHTYTYELTRTHIHLHIKAFILKS